MPGNNGSSPVSRGRLIFQSLSIGKFPLQVETITKYKKDNVHRRYTGVSGTGWITLACVDTPHLLDQFAELAGNYRLKQHLEVVTTIADPLTQITLEQAKKAKPDAKLGESIQLKSVLDNQGFQEIIRDDLSLVDSLGKKTDKGQILVEFKDVVVKPIKRYVGEIVDGEAIYPARERIPRSIPVSLNGFELTINSIKLSPKGATANITVEIPGEIYELDSCQKASLDFYSVPIDPECHFSITEDRAKFGPWIVDNTGIVISGTGYSLNLAKATTSPFPVIRKFTGLRLHNGIASGADTVPEPCNTGYLRGHFNFRNGLINKSGFDARLNLEERFTFRTLQPLNYEIRIEGGWLKIEDSSITAGEFGPGCVSFPLKAVCKDNPGNVIEASFAELVVESDLDLVGELDCGGGLPISWGELSRTGKEEVSWSIEAGKGVVYLPADAVASFSPAAGGTFDTFGISYIAANNIATLESKGVAGAVVYDFENLHVYSPDRPGGVANYLDIHRANGWLRIENRGLDGELNTMESLEHQELGEPARFGYVGNTPFASSLFGLDKINLVAEFADSAVFDSALDGYVKIPEPCKIDQLDFSTMQLSSTCHLVGGDVHLPVGGVDLAYWELSLVPTGDPTQAGVLSVRTGRIVFTAAAISEPIHFSQPFRLTWGEMLADGNLGELFFDYNNYGQYFDQLPYVPQHIMLSEYDPAVTDPYLATCGTVHFSFFGPHFINLRDAKHTDASAPFFKRYVTAPKNGEDGCSVTDLNLQRRWDDLTGDMLADFNFPDPQMDYHEVAQNGFLGSGSTVMSFIHSTELSATIEIHGETIDIRITADSTHELDLGLWTRVGDMSAIYGCARIEGPLLERISIYGMLEHATSTGMGIMAPKTGAVVEVNLTTTPTSVDILVEGDLLLQVAGSAVDVFASVHLLHDFSRHSTEGEVLGRIDCNSIMGGMEAEGQLTWYIDPGMQYLQGRMKVFLCGWVSSAGLEGGMFIGHNVDKALAWVLQTDNERFGVSNAILPDYLTGLYGYGRLSFSIDFFLFGGGIELYAGMGAFSEAPGTLIGEDWSTTPSLGLPYVIGSCGVYVHGEILGGLVSASAWADLDLRGPVPTYFEGSFGLEGCVLWVLCASVTVTAGFNSDGFYVT